MKRVILINNENNKIDCYVNVINDGFETSDQRIRMFLGTKICAGPNGTGKFIDVKQKIAFEFTLTHTAPPNAFYKFWRSISYDEAVDV